MENIRKEVKLFFGVGEIVGQKTDVKEWIAGELSIYGKKLDEIIEEAAEILKVKLPDAFKSFMSEKVDLRECISYNEYEAYINWDYCEEDGLEIIVPVEIDVKEIEKQYKKYLAAGKDEEKPKTLGQLIDEKFYAEDFTGYLGEARSKAPYQWLPDHIKDFIDELYGMAFKIVSEEQK